MEYSAFNVLQMDCTVNALLDPQVLEVMRRMHLLAFSISSLKTGNVIMDRGTISSSIYTVEHRLLSLRSSYRTSLVRDDKSILSEALLLAQHIFLHLAIRELPRTAKMHKNMLTRLESTLLDYLVMVKLDTSQVRLQPLCWILFVGAAATPTPAHRPLFPTRLWQVCQSLRIQSLADFKEVIQKVLWMNEFCELQCDCLWKEMTEVRTER